MASLADFVVCAGRGTLVGGTLTIKNTEIQAGDCVIAQRTSGLGSTFVCGTNFVGVATAGQVKFDSLDLANPSALVATDTSTLAYIIVRQTNAYGVYST
jgi:hypothetical protein